MIAAKPLSIHLPRLSEAQKFMLLLIVVNGGNYFYNLALAQILGPRKFAHAAFLITGLLSLSFIAMTFQLVVVRFYKVLNAVDRDIFLSKWSRWSLLLGGVLGLIIFKLSSVIGLFFQFDDPLAIKVFALAMPFYFWFNVYRGKLQAEEKFVSLGLNYFVEMSIRLFATLPWVLWFPFTNSLSVSLGILISILASCYIVEPLHIFRKISKKLPRTVVKHVLRFVIVTLLYELTLNLLCSADILIVKRNFTNTYAGIYASIALVGRMLYYVTWMYVMVLLPGLIRCRLDGKDVRPIFSRTLKEVSMIIFGVVGLTFLYPELIINLLFGSEYLSHERLLGGYALASGLFCLSNVFSYTFLSLSKYGPVLMSAFVAIVQVIFLYHIDSSIEKVVFAQIISMSILCFFQLIYYMRNREVLSPCDKKPSTFLHC